MDAEFNIKLRQFHPSTQSYSPEDCVVAGNSYLVNFSVLLYIIYNAVHPIQGSRAN